MTCIATDLQKQQLDMIKNKKKSSFCPKKVLKTENCILSGIDGGLKVVKNSRFASVPRFLKTYLSSSWPSASKKSTKNWVFRLHRWVLSLGGDLIRHFCNTGQSLATFWNYSLQSWLWQWRTVPSDIQLNVPASIARLCLLPGLTGLTVESHGKVSPRFRGSTRRRAHSQTTVTKSCIDEMLLGILEVDLVAMFNSYFIIG